MTNAGGARLTLLRHGKSVWNLQNRFTGWVDVSLSDAGRTEARAAAAAMRQHGLQFDVAFVSCLKRAIATLWTALEEMDAMHLPQFNDWRLNERHYGALQGRNKSEATAEFGAEAVQRWRRGYDAPPPPLTAPQAPLAGIAPPQSESLKTVAARVGEVYEERILPLLSAGKNVLVVAHGNSLRALIKRLEGLDDAEIAKVELPTATPWLYEMQNSRAQRLPFSAD